MSGEPTALARPEDASDALLADLRAIIAGGRSRAAAAVNAEAVATYWSIGERIVREEQGGYEQMAIHGRWSSRELERQINTMLYERTAVSRQPEQIIAAATSGEETSPAVADAFEAGGQYNRGKKGVTSTR
jgi:hypothetical protein